MKKFLLLAFATLLVSPCVSETTIKSSNNNNLTGNNSDSIVSEQNEDTYTIRFLNDEGTEISSNQYKFGVMPEAPATPSKEHPLDEYKYTFSGWSPSIALVTADADYVATYKVEAKIGEVVWVDGDGETLLTENYAYGSMPNYHGDIPTKTATDTETFVFNGWSPEIVLVSKELTTYVAQFNPIPVSMKYSIQINCFDCLVNKKKSINEEHTVLSDLSYQFNTTSDETYHYPYKLGVTVDGVSSNDYLYDNITGRLSFKLTGNTVINAVADNSCVLMRYEYSADCPTVEFTCNGDFAEVDWGDGVVDTNKSHTYSFDPNKDTHDIRVYGKLGDFSIHSKAITSTNIFHSVNFIPASAFKDCSSLVSITFPISATTFGSNCFYNCPSLTIYCRADSATLHYYQTTWNSDRPFYLGYLFSGSTSDFDYVVQRVNGIKQIAISKYLGDNTSVVVPNEISIDGENLPVASIGGYAFKPSINNVNLPNTITSIESHAFYNCGSLNTITIPEGVTFIGSYAFSNCDSLNTITIPEGVTSINDSTFSYCDSLNTIIIPKSVTSIGSYAFYDCSVSIVTIPKSVNYIGNYAFLYCNVDYYCEAESKPGGWSSLWDGGGTVHWGCRLGSTNDFYYVAENLNQIKQVIILKYIGTNDVVNVPNQISVDGENLPVVSIGPYAFDGCNFVTNISVCDSVTSIGDCAFCNCSSLELLDLSTCDRVVSAGYSFLKNTKSTLQIKVKASLEDQYKAASYWKDYADKIVGVE